MSDSRNSLDKHGQSINSNQPAFFHNQKNTPTSKQVERFLRHVIRGEQDEVKKMSQQNSLLLLEKGSVKDYSGRTCEGTALQLALAAGDVKCHDHEIGMVEMLQEILRTLPDGEAIIHQQTAKQFPEGWEEAQQIRSQNDLNALDTVINTIANSSDGDNCEAAIQLFRDYLDQQKQNVFKTGIHFNHQLLIRAFDSFNENYNRFGGFSSPKNQLFWIKVIGYIERDLPANYAQAFCQGVYDVMPSGPTERPSSGMLKRDLRIPFYNTSLFPLDSVSDDYLGKRLGYDFAIGSEGKQHKAGGPVDVVSRGSANFYSQYVAKRNEQLNTYITDCVNVKEKPAM